MTNNHGRQYQIRPSYLRQGSVLTITLPGLERGGWSHGDDARLLRMAADICDAAEEGGWCCSPAYIDSGTVRVEADEDTIADLSRQVQRALAGKFY